MFQNQTYIQKHIQNILYIYITIICTHTHLYNYIYYYIYIYHSRKYKCKCIQMPHWSHSQDTQWSNQSQNRHFHDHRRQAAQLAHAMTSGAWDEVDAEQTRRPGTAAPLGPPGGGVSQGAEVRRPSTTGGEGLGKRGLGLVEFFRMNCHESW